MGLFDNMTGASGGQPQPATAPAAPTPTQSPVGSKPKPKKNQATFLGTDTTPDATQTSNKTLLGQ